jgi:hypothetical protein
MLTTCVAQLSFCLVSFRTKVTAPGAQSPGFFADKHRRKLFSCKRAFNQLKLLSYNDDKTGKSPTNKFQLKQNTFSTFFLLNPPPPPPLGVRLFSVIFYLPQYLYLDSNPPS